MSSKDDDGKNVDDSSSGGPGVPFPIYWTQLPSIKIIRQAKGRYSPRADERCVTYCSQSVRGRAEHREPWCRTFCLRRVFAHEVQRALSAPSAHPHAQPQSPLPPARTPLPTPHAPRFPLPPEGQRPASLASLLIGETPEGAEARCWEEGWYVWWSKSRWAAQEKLDLMHHGLEHQAQWERYKKLAVARWEEEEQRRLRDDAHGPRPGAGTPQPQAEAEAADDAHRPSGSGAATSGLAESPAPARRPFPDLSGQSILLPLPPALPPIRAPLGALLAPAHTLLGLTSANVRSGEQARFLARAWETARTDAPFALARTVCARMWEKWRKGPPPDDAA